MSDSEFEKITPADISLSSRKPSPEVSVDSGTSPSLGLEQSRQLEHHQKNNIRILWGIFGLLLILVVGVILILPDYVSAPDISMVTARTVATSSAETGPVLRLNQISPFEEAQKLKQREDTQNVLAAFLEIQQTLAEKNVPLWAEDQIAGAIDQARSGDASYRQQDFVQAQDFYQQGLTILQNIENGIPDVFASFMEEGSEAILKGQPEQAESAFTIALSIYPDNAEAQLGVDRSQVLVEVLELMETGSILHENNQLEAAENLYEQALAIDPNHLGAREAINTVTTDILDRNFSRLMSAGYAFLQSSNPELSEDSFNRALGLKPESSEAKAAVEQAADQITFSAINIRLNQAQEHTVAERWQQALEEYNAALAIDPNLVAAIDGRNLTDTRAGLDRFLEATIQNPLRLGEEQVYQEATRILNDARRIPDPGPRLSSQLQQIQSFLEKARQPVNVTFRSDGLTDVTIYRVGSLGLFTSQTLALTPGAYIAVGFRSGYRDTREEFVVTFDGQAPVITIQCDEEIL